MPSIVWKGHLTFGLVSIPVKLFRAARRERVSLHYVHRPAVAEPPSYSHGSPGAAWDDGVNDGDASPITAQRPSDRFETAMPKAGPDIREAIEQAAPPAPVTRVRQSLVSSTDEEPIS